MIREFETVKVLRLLEAKSVLGSESVLRQPKVDDTGVVVAIRDTEWGETIYTVERVTSDGRTEWLADLRRAEIEPVAAVS
jgi:hypothetical protein